MLLMTALTTSENQRSEHKGEIHFKLCLATSATDIHELSLINVLFYVPLLNLTFTSLRGVENELN